MIYERQEDGEWHPPVPSSVFLSLFENHPHITQGSEEWKRVREWIVTASDVAYALNLAPISPFTKGPKPPRYQQSETLLKQKSRLIAPFMGNAVTARGHALEPDALAHYVTQNKNSVLRVGLIIHKTIRWLGASPDGIVLTTPQKLIEIKCPASRRFNVGDNVPVQYWPQCQIQCEVCELDECDFVDFKPETKRSPVKCNTVRVRRCKKWFAASEPLLQHFVETLVKLHALADVFCPEWMHADPPDLSHLEILF
jgi:putative phage-type endonuclease